VECDEKGKQTNIEALAAFSDHAFDSLEEVSCGPALIVDATAPVVLACAYEDVLRVRGRGVEERCFAVDVEILGCGCARTGW
jgi:hypothetical protein